MLFTHLLLTKLLLSIQYNITLEYFLLKDAEVAIGKFIRNIK